MNPDAAQLLSQLRDIHGAPPVSWWPPAPGWWLLALLLMVVLAWLVRIALNALRVRRRKRQLLGFVSLLEETLDHDRDPQAYLSALNRIFKLVAIRAFPDQPCAAMQGPAWAEFLTAHLDDSADSNTLQALAHGPYQPSPGFDAEQLARRLRQWIRRYG